MEMDVGDVGDVGVLVRCLTLRWLSEIVLTAITITDTTTAVATAQHQQQQ